MPGTESEFENKKSPEEVFEETKFMIATELRRAITAGLNRQLSSQTAEGLEPETNGMSTMIIRAAGERSFGTLWTGSHTLTASVSVAAMKPKTQEPHTGSDIAVFFEVLPRAGSRTPIVSKTLLIQAKVGKINANGELTASDRHLPGQIAQIQRISPNDGFLLVYTAGGAYCIEVDEAAQNLKRNTVRTKNFKDAGDMIYQMVICKAGNEPSISPATLKPQRNANGDIEVSDAAQRLAELAKTPRVEEAIGFSLTIRDRAPRKRTEL